ncbi:MAG: ABC transporter permease [Bdellovibrionales bacterium]|nr:ABC transporter permease [Bdellovibrionales bacterium]
MILSLSWRSLTKSLALKQSIFNFPTLLSVLGVVIGVGSLVVAMAVVSGYQSTLKKSVIDVTSHLIVSRPNGQGEKADFNDVLQDIKGPMISTSFVYIEALLPHNEMLSGIALEGVDIHSVHRVLNLKSRVIQGEFVLESRRDESAALIGKGLAAKHHLKVGDSFRLVLPSSQEFDKGQVKPRIGHFFVSGILDMGRHDFDERYVLTDLLSAQKFAQIGDRITGFRIRLAQDDLAPAWSRELAERYRSRFYITSWYDVNQNLFRAIELEKPVIFFVIMVIVIAAAFNICSTLLINVVQKYRDISILKTMGAKKMTIAKIFACQGLIIGSVGAFLGLAFGLFACAMFVWMQNRWQILPAEVYKLDKVTLELRWLDLIMIFLSTMLVCFLATLVPARRGANLPPVEGLRYE